MKPHAEHVEAEIIEPLPSATAPDEAMPSETEPDEAMLPPPQSGVSCPEDPIPQETAELTPPGAEEASTVPPEVPTVVLLPVADLKEHKAAKNVPGMGKKEWKDLRADILVNGVRTPLLVQKGNITLDGRHRLKAAKERGDTHVPAIVVDLSEDEQTERVYSEALLRRHLTDDQRATLAVLWLETANKQSCSDRASKGGTTGGRNRPKKQNDSSAPTGDAELSPTAATTKPRTQRGDEKAAAQFNVSRNKVRKAATLLSKSPQEFDKVAAGDQSLREGTKNARGTQEKDPAKNRLGKGKTGKDRPVETHPAEPAPPDCQKLVVGTDKAWVQTFKDLADRLKERGGSPTKASWDLDAVPEKAGDLLGRLLDLANPTREKLPTRETVAEEYQAMSMADLDDLAEDLGVVMSAAKELLCLVRSVQKKRKEDGKGAA